MHSAHEDGLMNTIYCVRIYKLIKETVMFSDLSEEGKQTTASFKERTEESN